MKQRIGFIYLKTGAGHIAGAKALSAKLMDLYPDQAECHLKDGFDQGAWFLKFFFEKGYLASTNYFEPGYVAFYQLYALSPMLHLLKKLITPYTVPNLVNFLKSNKITKLVCLHHTLIPICREAINRVNPNIPLISIVTDPFTVHPIWFFERNTELIVFSKKALQEGLAKHKFPAEKLHQFPLILSEKFDKPYTQDQIASIKDKLGIPKDKKIVLIVGGGEGLKNANSIVQAFIKNKSEIFLIVVCGNNRPLRHSLEYLVQFYNLKNIKIFGFVSFIPDLMNIADCVITKCGASTPMEALALGKPVIISTYIKGQELGNMLYITQNKLGWYIPKPKHIVEKITEIFSDNRHLEEVREQIKKMNIRNGLNDIADFIWNFKLPINSTGTIED
ncbi:glycosyltransferase [Treponema sp. OMZ 788]|uniref:glycosyltransferase n=1 Tax=Treponema sp. OMZ 788 TaxID=2563664 RepID=UPI0020A3D543|nr:glycosyltransferase [Treponema sp. OMZ 788]UTC63785.1 glycosyltransferase [Treponema sp. OMZ 788]